METRNIIFVVGLLLACGLLFFAITTAVDEDVYLMPVDKAVAEQSRHEGTEVKVQGNVVPGSIILESKTVTRFKLTKGGETIEVSYEGARPDTFKDCADVIVTGELYADRSFTASDMIAKCPSKYDELPGGCETAPEGVADGMESDEGKAGGGYGGY